MNNTNQQLYVIYRNTQSFYRYRGLVSIDDDLPQERFIKAIQKDKFKLLTAVARSDVVDSNDEIDERKRAELKRLVESYNEKSDPRDVRLVHILLVYPGTDCESKKANMSALINHVRFPRAEVVVVTPVKVSSSISKYLTSLSGAPEHEDHEFRPFTYTLLNAILPDHELVPKYTILNAEEVSGLKQWLIDPNSLPKIFENDPQMVWIGAKVGDVVRFVAPCEVTIESVGYCTVIPPI